MTAKKSESKESAQVTDTKVLEAFVNDYLKAYHNSISNRNMDPLHLPQFYKSYPLSSEAYLLPNGALCATFKKASRSKINILEGANEDILGRLRSQDFDFLQVFPPFTSFTASEAARLAKLDADRDVKASRRLEMLTAAEAHLSEMHGDIQAMVDLNPWLDRQTEEQKAKLDNAKKLITELYSEVDISREERFSDYMRQVSEVIAMESGEIENLAGEMEMELKGAMEEVGERLQTLEDQIKANQKDSEELFTIMKDINQKIRGIEKSASSGIDAEQLEDASRLIKENAKRLASLQKQFDDVKKDVAISQEIKETVFRDSKRTYNLNERITELERTFANMGKDAGKSSKSELRAMEGKLNVLENGLKEYVRKYVQAEIENSRPTQTVTVERVDPALAGGSIPPGATVKKTTRTTTKKKRVQ